MTSESVIFAYSADQVSHLTGLSKRQLSYWDRTGFFSPRYAFENRRSPFSRVYSFKDVVGLRTLSILRKSYRIPLQQLRKVAQKLSRQMKEPWSDTVLYVIGKEVHFKEPDTQRVRSVLTGQYVADISLKRIANEIAQESEKLKTRSRAQFGQIERKRSIQHNATVIAGTRIPTRTIWRFHKAGYNLKEIIREYPTLTRQDVAAAVEYEANQVKRA